MRDEPTPDETPSGESDSNALWTLPNQLTLLRIFLVPVLMVFLLAKFQWTGLVVFLAASLTDWLDGYLARRRQQITTLGQLLDPLADKLLMSAAFISLVELGVAPGWMVVVIIGREMAITGLRGLAAERQIVIAASRAGKYKLGAQVVAVSILILSDRFAELVPLGRTALWVVMLLSAYSGTRYFLKFWKGITAPR